MIKKRSVSIPHDALARESMPSLLSAQVQEHPDRTAVMCADRQLTYRELADHGQGLAAYLRHLGIAGDACVGMFVEPSIDLMVGAWGILLSGGAYLPLSPEYPEERLRYMIEDSRATTLFTQDKLVDRLADLAPRGVRIVTLRSAGDFVASSSRMAQLAGPRPDHLAYVIYTSGSTGKPKGVMIEHRSIASQMRWLRRTYRLNEDRIILQKTPMSFDAAQWEILARASAPRWSWGALASTAIRTS
jgi:non-ribosomal peptide synthetase component F